MGERIISCKYKYPFVPRKFLMVKPFTWIFLTSFATWLIKPTLSETYYCGLGKHIFLCLITFGIWHLRWIYRITKYLNKAPHNTEYYDPTSNLLLCMFVPFYAIYWYYKQGQRIDSFSKSKGLINSDIATLCLIFGNFVPIVACIIMQDKINVLCTTKAIPSEQSADNKTAEQLKKLKELLDNGVITLEEFNAVKKKLLGLQ